MSATVTIFKRSLQARKKMAEDQRDHWLSERRKYLKEKEKVLALCCKMIAGVHQSYARDFRDMMKGG